MDGHGHFPPRAPYPPMPPQPMPMPVAPAPLQQAPNPAGTSPWQMTPPGWSQAPARHPGFPATEPPAGLPPHPAGAYPHPARPPKRGGSRFFVVAVVVVIGMLLASGVVAMGYTVMNRGGIGTGNPVIAAPVPASQTSPAAGTSPLAPSPGPTDTGATGPGTTLSDPGTPVTSASGRKPGVTPRVDPVYVAAMRERPAFAGTSDADLYALGESTCGKLDDGESFMAVVSAGGGRNVQPEDMGYLIGVSVMAYCPQHKPMLEKLIGQPLPTI